jgi:NCAIR mutase (PurE)-related protein
MSTNTDVQEQLASIQPILEAAHTVIDSMKLGERKQIKTLAQEVGAKLGKEAKDVLGFVNHFAHNTKIAYVTRGKNGGIIKGVKPVKTPKVSKKDKAADTFTTPTV